MYYSTIEIKPDINHKYRVNYYNLPYNRETTKGSMNAGIGFYHYSRKKKIEIAFNELKEAMIEQRLKLILELSEDIKELKQLTL